MIRRTENEKSITLTFSGPDFERLLTIAHFNRSVPREVSWRDPKDEFTEKKFRDFLDEIRHLMEGEL